MIWERINWDTVQGLGMIIGALVVFLGIGAIQRQYTRRNSAHFDTSVIDDMRKEGERMHQDAQRAYYRDYYDYQYLVQRDVPPQ